MHLTNVAVQKTAPGYDAGAGCKWPLRQLKLYLLGKFGVQATDRLFAEMQEMIILSLLSVQKASGRERASPAPSPRPLPGPASHAPPRTRATTRRHARGARCGSDRRPSADGR